MSHRDSAACRTWFYLEIQDVCRGDFVQHKYADLANTRALFFDNFFVNISLQGSYGIVKLAYNEEDDVHYVSPLSLQDIVWCCMFISQCVHVGLV